MILCRLTFLSLPDLEMWVFEAYWTRIIIRIIIELYPINSKQICFYKFPAITCKLTMRMIAKVPFYISPSLNCSAEAIELSCWHTFTLIGWMFSKWYTGMNCDVEPSRWETDMDGVDGWSCQVIKMDHWHGEVDGWLCQVIKMDHWHSEVDGWVCQVIKMDHYWHGLSWWLAVTGNQDGPRTLMELIAGFSS